MTPAGPRAPTILYYLTFFDLFPTGYASSTYLLFCRAFVDLRDPTSGRGFSSMWLAFTVWLVRHLLAGVAPVAR